MFGSMKPIPREEYMRIYQSTGLYPRNRCEIIAQKYFGLEILLLLGIDVDGRRELITHMIPCLEKSIKRFIAFAKALPGFKEIPIEDQIALIKGW